MWRSCGAGVGQPRELSMGKCYKSVGVKTSLWEKPLQSECMGQALCSRLWGTDYDYDHMVCQHPGGPRTTLLVLTCDQSGKEATAPSSEEARLTSQGAGLLKTNATLTLTPRTSVPQH